MMYSGQCNFFSLVVDEFVYIDEEIGDTSANDYKEITKMKGVELIKELKQVKPRNIK